MSRRHRCLRLVASALTLAVPLTLVACASGSSSAPPQRLIDPGASGSFDFGISGNGLPAQIRIWYDAPAEGLSVAPILFVMTGRQRNAQEYRDQWRALARKHGALVIVPELSEELFPGTAYNLGNLAGASDTAVPERTSAFAVLEPLYDAIAADVGSSTTSYFLYGHSAGAQFVHRFVIFQQPNRIAKAVVANAGWYTALDDETPFPYGLDDSPVTSDAILRALGTPMIVLLGEDDDVPSDEGLRTTKGAMAQGAHRLARGKFFFASGRAAADRHDVPFHWRIFIVPDAGHDNEEMAPAAAALLFD